MNTQTPTYLQTAARDILEGNDRGPMSRDNALDSADAWLLEAWCSPSLELQLEALMQALEFDPENELAQHGIAWIEGISDTAQSIVFDVDTAEGSLVDTDAACELESELEASDDDSSTETFVTAGAVTAGAATLFGYALSEDADEVEDSTEASDDDSAADAEAEAKRKAEAEAKAEEERKAEAEAEAERKAEEEAEAKRKEEEAAEAKAEEEAEAKRKEEAEAEAEAKAEEERKAEEEAEAERKAEAEAEAARKEEAAEAKAEEEAEAKRKEEAEAEAKAEEERKAEEEAEAELNAEEEAEEAEVEVAAERKAEKKAEAKRQAEEEAQRLEEETAAVEETESTEDSSLAINAAVASAFDGLAVDDMVEAEIVAEAIDEPFVASAEAAEQEIQDDIAELSEEIQEVVADTPAKPAEPTTTAPAPSTSGKTLVLAVDDSPTIRKLVSLTLEREGFEVITACDGLEAVQLLTDHMPDIILSDVNMPRLDGYKLCRFIKKSDRTKHIPVIMLSGKDGVFDKLRGKMFGCGDYVTKPFESSELIEKVRTHTGTHAS